MSTKLYKNERLKKRITGVFRGLSRNVSSTVPHRSTRSTYSAVNTTSTIDLISDAKGRLQNVTDDYQSSGTVLPVVTFRITSTVTKTQTPSLQSLMEGFALPLFCRRQIRYF